MPSSSQDLRPRLCLLDKGDNGYGFHLHGEKGKTGQFIRLVEPDSPSEVSGLRAGDRLVFVNGENVENESHQQVVSRIRATAGKLELIVVDVETEQLLRKHNLRCQKEFVTEGIPVPSSDSRSNGDAEEKVSSASENGGSTPRESTPVPDNNGELVVPEEEEKKEKKLSVSSEKDVKNALRPRLCVIGKGQSGYGFNLHSEKTRPGQYVRAVDPDSPAERAGLLPKDRIIEVNGVNVEGRQHSQVVSLIRSGGDEATLLVVDPDAEIYFKRCRVTPTLEHLTGPLPEPVTNGDMEDKANGKVAEKAEPKVSVSPSPSNASSNASLSTPPTSTPPPEVSESAPPGEIPALSMSLKQVKELAHQKRMQKKAPAMDWSKKNELFSNL
ncbi:Na(+)/H(+) exchange regulatory cofactor NHE-RF1 isoform X2 [Sardina pilchardus]|uniref:Na(+)/H(+) exchange regulatory cofactor NHE-RF1 isoform X1 n=1 Tax=Sardina pilchardus TaxID=27697 RepID=UPI002E13E6AB